MLEEKNKQDNFRTVKLHLKASKILTNHPPNGFTFQVSKRDTSIVKNNIQTTNFVSKKEPSIKHIHDIRSHY